MGGAPERAQTAANGMGRKPCRAGFRRVKRGPFTAQRRKIRAFFRMWAGRRRIPFPDPPFCGTLLEKCERKTGGYVRKGPFCTQPQRADAPGQSLLLPAGLAGCQGGGRADGAADRGPGPGANRGALDEPSGRGPRWLGLDWDEGYAAGGTCGPYCQRERTALYDEAFQTLKELGAVYPCWCSRHQRLAASAPHPGEERDRGACACRKLSRAEQEARAW